MGQLLRRLAKIIQGWFASTKDDKLYNQAVECYNTYLTSKNPTDLDNAFTSLKSARTAWKEEQETESSTPDSYPDLLLNLGNAYFSEYVATKQASYFDKTFEIYDDLMKLPGVQVKTRATVLLIMGEVLIKASTFNSTTDRLDESIGYLKDALKLADPTKEPDEKIENQQARFEDMVDVEMQCLYKLATAYDMCYQDGLAIEDLDEAIQFNNRYKNKVKVSSPHPDYASCLYNLARQHFARYERVQRDKVGPVLLDDNLDKSSGIEDLEAADAIAKEAQGVLLRGDYAASHPLKVALDDLVRVIGEHRDGLSKHSASISRQKSSLSTGTRSQNSSQESSRQSSS